MAGNSSLRSRIRSSSTAIAAVWITESRTHAVRRRVSSLGEKNLCLRQRIGLLRQGACRIGQRAASSTLALKCLTYSLLSHDAWQLVRNLQINPRDKYVQHGVELRRKRRKTTTQCIPQGVSPKRSGMVMHRGPGHQLLQSSSLPFDRDVARSGCVRLVDSTANPDFAIWPTHLPSLSLEIGLWKYHIVPMARTRH